MEYIYYTWQEIGNMIEKLISRIKELNLKYDGVYGIPKGGLPIAVAVANHLNLPMLLNPTENTLVIDDISDTGKTLTNIKSKVIGCLFSSSWTTVIPDVFVEIKISKEDWIIYPWEEKIDKEQTTLEDFK